MNGWKVRIDRGFPGSVWWANFSTENDARKWISSRADNHHYTIYSPMNEIV